MRLRRSFCALVVLTLLSAPAIAGIQTWTINGPGGGTVSKLAFDPLDPTIAYAATPNGLFRSTDGGLHWAAAVELLGTPVSEVAVANSDPGKVFAASVYGLYKSSDRGLTWKTVHPFASFEVTVAATNANVVYSLATSGPIRSSDGGVTFGSTGSGLPSPTAGISALAADPQNVDTVYALNSNMGVYKSVDGGAHWTAANTGMLSSRYFSLAIDPVNGSTLYAGAAEALYRSNDGAASWTALQTTEPSAYYYSLAISAASSPSTVIAGTSRGLIKSTSGGSTWTPAVSSNDLAVAIDPSNPTNLLALSQFSLFRSTDGGANFSSANSGLNANYTQPIAVDPRNASVVYTSGPEGIFKSVDRGGTWSPAGPFAGFVAVDPFDSQTLYAISSGGPLRSVNGGGDWQNFATGLPSSSARVIVPDPQVPETLYTTLGNSVYKRIGSDPWAIRSTGLPSTGSWSSFRSIRAILPRFTRVETGCSRAPMEARAGLKRTVESPSRMFPASRSIRSTPITSSRRPQRRLTNRKTAGAAGLH